MPSTKIEMLEFVLRAAERAGVKIAIGGGVAVASHGYLENVPRRAPRKRKV